MNKGSGTDWTLAQRAAGRFGASSGSPRLHLDHSLRKMER